MNTLYTVQPFPPPAVYNWWSVANLCANGADTTITQRPAPSWSSVQTVDGREVPLRVDRSGDRVILDLGNAAPGQYFVQVPDGRSLQTRSIIVR